MNGSMIEAQVEAGFRELVAVEGAGHASNVSHPAVVNEAMVRFLPSI
jgi:pimeloyl-ACP methyl ester carboxylesterase